jgi:hypothetical protein
MKLKQGELQGFRDAAYENQDGQCGICGNPIVEDEVLDHDHKTGRIRAVLHRSCNRGEGIAKNALKWISGSTPETLRAIADYMERDWTDRPLHPNHKTPNDKRLKLLRVRVKKAKTKAGKDKIKAEIKETVKLIAQQYLTN